MNIIDSHVHFWNYDPINYAWIDQGMHTLQTNFTPKQLEAIYKTHHISGCIAVEAHQSINETRQLLSLSSQHSFIKGVVGYVNLLADNIEEQLLELKQYKKLKGFRMALQPNFMLQPSFLKGISKLQEHQFTYDLLLLPKHLVAATQLVSQFPDQKFVINHLAKPNVKTNENTVWQQNLEAIAKYPNVYCKISGLVTEANWSNWNAATLKPYLDIVVENFGINRILFGSDWPVCLLASQYEQWLKIIGDYFKDYSITDQTKVLSTNTQLFYNL